MTDAPQTPEEWFARSVPELDGARAAWRGGNPGRGRVGARRAAGMALKGWLATHPREGYGRSFMHHLAALADDASVPVAVREAAARLCARPRPPEGFRAPLPEPLTPVTDAEIVIAWARAEAGEPG